MLAYVANSEKLKLMIILKELFWREILLFMQMRLDGLGKQCQSGYKKVW